MQHCGKKRKGCQERILAGRDLLMFGTRANYHLRQWSVIHFSKARFRNIAEILAPIPPTHCTHQGHLPFAWLVPAAHPKAILNPHYCCSRAAARTSFIPLSLSRSDSQLHFQALYRATQKSWLFVRSKLEWVLIFTPIDQRIFFCTGIQFIFMPNSVWLIPLRVLYLPTWMWMSLLFQYTLREGSVFSFGTRKLSQRSRNHARQAISHQHTSNSPSLSCIPRLSPLPPSLIDIGSQNIVLLWHWQPSSRACLGSPLMLLSDQ